MIDRLGRGPTGALVLGGAMLLCLAVARLEQATLIANPLFTVSTIVAAVGLGYVLGQADNAVFRPPWRDLVVVLATALATALLVKAWNGVRPGFAAPEWQWLRVVMDGLRLLPALLPAAIVRRPGAVLTGLTVSQTLNVALGASLPAFALLIVPLVAVLPELWLMARRQEMAGLTLPLAGVLTGVPAALLERADLVAVTRLWPLLGVVVSACLAGVLFGFLARALGERLRPRLGYSDASVVAVAPP